MNYLDAEQVHKCCKKMSFSLRKSIREAGGQMVTPTEEQRRAATEGMVGVGLDYSEDESLLAYLIVTTGMIGEVSQEHTTFMEKHADVHREVKLLEVLEKTSSPTLTRRLTPKDRNEIFEAVEESMALTKQVAREIEADTTGDVDISRFDTMFDKYSPRIEDIAVRMLQFINHSPENRKVH